MRIEYAAFPDGPARIGTRGHAKTMCSPVRFPYPRRRGSILAALFLLPVLLSGPSAAADDNQRFHEERLRQQQQIDAEREKRFEARPDAIGPAPAVRADDEAATEAPCFAVREISFELMPGSRAPAAWEREFDWIAGASAWAMGKCLGVNGLNRVVRKLTDEAIRRGRTTTRFTFPPQDFSSGGLRIAVVPGLISAIRFADPDSGDGWRTALASRPGDFLDLRVIEQALEQFGRLPSVEASFDLLPGENPGESEILIRRKRGRPWRASVFVDDGGARAAGRFNTTATFASDDPLGFNDLLSLSVGSGTLIDGRGQSSRNGSVNYSVPFGFWTFSAYLTAYDYRQVVQGAFEKFVRSGDADSIEFRVDRVVDRDQVSKTSIDFRVARRNSRLFIDDVELDVQRRRTTSLQLGASHRRYLGSAVLEASFALRRGGPWLGAMDDDPDLPPGSPTTRYAMTTVDATLSVPFRIGSLPMQYRIGGRAQKTRDPVLGTEFFSIGGRYTVRGFDGEHSLAAEQGWLVRNDFVAQLPGIWPELYIGVDRGQVSGPSTALLAGTRLAGIAFGARKTIDGYSIDVFVGRPLLQPQGFGADKLIAGFQLGFSL